MLVVLYFVFLSLPSLGKVTTEKSTWKRSCLVCVRVRKQLALKPVEARSIVVFKSCGLRHSTLVVIDGCSFKGRAENEFSMFSSTELFGEKCSNGKLWRTEETGL